MSCCVFSTDAALVQGTEGFPGLTAPKLFLLSSVAGYAGNPSSRAGKSKGENNTVESVGLMGNATAL